jgi:NAD-dependent dihydropyrimidine dehydrogenase PreA subunit
MIALLLTDLCTGCQRCVEVCPRNVFDPAPAPKGHGTVATPTIARLEDCQTCFQCELYCQADALYVEPTVDKPVAVDQAAVRASGLLGVFRRDSGWHEWQDDPRYPNEHWRMEEVFARGRSLPPRTAPAPETSTKATP